MFEREDPFIKLALDVLGACSFCVGRVNDIKLSVRHSTGHSKTCKKEKKTKNLSFSKFRNHEYLNAQAKQGRDLFLQIISDHSIYLLHVRCKLLFKQ